MASPLYPPSAFHTPENPPNYATRHVQGYPLLSYFFSISPQYFHIRRFSALAVRILLYHQHELIVLENKLLDLDEQNQSNGYNLDHGLVTQNSEEDKDKLNRLHTLLEEIAKRMKEYEEALIRFDPLGSKRRDSTKLKHVQQWLAQPEGGGLALRGLDAKVWGTIEEPSRYAVDIIQVVEPPETSTTGRLLQDAFLPWIHIISQWLSIYLHWPRKHPDRFRQYSYSTRVLENLSSLIGSIVISTLMCSAIVLMSLVGGTALSITTAIMIVLMVTTCISVFQNHQFGLTISAVCAVLVTLLVNNNSKNKYPPQ